MKKGAVTIAEMSIKVTVIAFLLKAFSDDDIDEIKAYIDANPFTDDLAMNRGQITVDSEQKIIYTGSAGAAKYIAMAYTKKSLNKRYTITVYQQSIPDESVPMIMAMIASGKDKKPRSRKKRIPHNLQPVLDEIKRMKKEEVKKGGVR